MPRPLLLVVVVVVAGLVAPATAAADRTISKRADLDGDAGVERVERRFVDCPEGTNAPSGPERCGYIAIVDGDTTRRLTPTTQRPKYDYGWQPYAPVVLRDLTGDGHPELIWELSTSGGTGSSPRRFGVHRWDGRRARRLLQLDGGRARGGLFALPFWLRPVPGRGGRSDLLGRDGLYGPDDSTCCPSFTRTRRYRYARGRMRVVRGSTRVRPT